MDDGATSVEQSSEAAQHQRSQQEQLPQQRHQAMPDLFVADSDEEEAEAAAPESDLNLGNVFGRVVEPCATAGMQGPPGHVEDEQEGECTAPGSSQSCQRLAPACNQQRLAVKSNQKPQLMPSYNFQKPLLLFDLNGVLINESNYARRNKKRTEFVPRPQLELLMELFPHYQVGIYSSATRPTVWKGVNAVTNILCSESCPAHTVAEGLFRAAGQQGFYPVLTRENTQPANLYELRHGGKDYDTVKPLAANGLDLRQTLLVDNELFKASPGEEANLLLMPTWQKCGDKGVATWRALITELIKAKDCQDLRSQVPDIVAVLRSVHASVEAQVEAEAEAAAAANLPQADPRLVAQAKAEARRAKIQARAQARAGATAEVQAELEAELKALAEDGAEITCGTKRMRTAAGRDVAQGVAPSMDLQHYCQQPGLHDCSDRPAHWGDRELINGVAHLAPPVHVQLGGKRGRQLPGAAPLYCGPTAGFSRAGGGMQASAHAQHHASRQPHLTALHHEVASFAHRALPSDTDLEVLAAVMAKVQQAANSLWPTAQACLFGSQASGLALPGCDADVVILGVIRDLESPATGFTNRDKVQAVDCLRQLVKELKQMGVLKSKPEVIAKAKVPIIKAWFVNLVEGALPMPIDISIGVANGAAAVGMVQQAVLDLPPLRPLCLILKALLRESGLNEVFQGGLSSYSLVNMIIAHLQCEGWDASRVIQGAYDLATPRGLGSDGSSQPEAGGALSPEQTAYLRSLGSVRHDGYDLGLLLTSFLQRFGRMFRYQSEAVSIMRGGITDKPGGWRQSGVMLLGVEDPQQVGRDIGAGSYNMHRVRQVFQEALAALQDSAADKVSSSIPSHAHAHHAHAHAHADAGTSGSVVVHGHQQEGVPAPVSERDLWAAVQRDGQSVSVTATADEAHASGSGAGTSSIAGDGPTLLDYVLDVKMALSRDATLQQIIPRLEQRQLWLRQQAPKPRAVASGPVTMKDFKKQQQEREAARASQNGNKRTDAGRQHKSAARAGAQVEGGLTKKQQTLQEYLDVPVDTFTAADGLRVLEELRQGQLPPRSPKVGKALQQRLQCIGLSLRQKEASKIGLTLKGKNAKPAAKKNASKKGCKDKRPTASKGIKKKPYNNHRGALGSPRGGWVAV